jgi:hypothetical protein
LRICTGRAASVPAVAFPARSSTLAFTSSNRSVRAVVGAPPKTNSARCTAPLGSRVFTATRGRPPKVIDVSVSDAPSIAAETSVSATSTVASAARFLTTTTQRRVVLSRRQRSVRHSTWATTSVVITRSAIGKGISIGVG